MSGPPRNEDKLNTIGIVVVGICGAVLVYCTIVALQAFYANDTSEVQTMADYGGNETTVKAMRSDQLRSIASYGMNDAVAGTYHMPIERGMQLIVDGVKNGDAAFVPAVGPANCRTSLPVPGRGHPDPTPGLVEGCPGAKSAAPAPAAPAGSGAGSGAAEVAPLTPTNGNATGGDAGSAMGTGSAAPAVTPVAPAKGSGARGHAR